MPSKKTMSAEKPAQKKAHAKKGAGQPPVSSVFREASEVWQELYRQVSRVFDET